MDKQKIGATGKELQILGALRELGKARACEIVSRNPKLKNRHVHMTLYRMKKKNLVSDGKMQDITNDFYIHRAVRFWEPTSFGLSLLKICEEHGIN